MTSDDVAITHQLRQPALFLAGMIKRIFRHDQLRVRGR
jgi:hypothetical protein